MEFRIDLNNESDEREILQILGEALGYSDGKFWGKNWDAFNDILRYLNVGGIWGDNKIISSPIVLYISNFQNFKIQAPQRFVILKEILEETKQRYSKGGEIFDYKFME
jgi:hypothetical protein